MDEKIEQALTENAALLQQLSASQRDELRQLAEWLVETFDAGGRLILAASGPMAVLVQFVAQHFVYRLELNRPLLPAVALGQDPALLAALVRQGEQSQLLVRQLQTLGATERDLLLVFADGGYDEGLKGLLLAAQELGCATAALVHGAVEEHFSVLPDLVLRGETGSPARFAEAVLFIGNLLCELVEAELFGV